MPNPTFYNLPEDKRNRITDAILEECSIHTFEHINISNIVRNAHIPRGSFYQYFKDTFDVFSFVLSKIGEVKMQYVRHLMDPDLSMPFLDRFTAIYMAGVRLAIDHPKLIQVGQKLMASDIFKENEMLKKSSEVAIDFYADFIRKDQELGLLSKDFPPRLLSEIMVEFSNKIMLDVYSSSVIDMNHIEWTLTQFCNLIKKGIDAHV